MLEDDILSYQFLMITRSEILEARHSNELYCADQSVHISGHEQGKNVVLDEDISRPVAQEKVRASYPALLLQKSVVLDETSYHRANPHWGHHRAIHWPQQLLPRSRRGTANRGVDQR